MAESAPNIAHQSLLGDAQESRSYREIETSKDPRDLALAFAQRYIAHLEDEIAILRQDIAISKYKGLPANLEGQPASPVSSTPLHGYQTRAQRRAALEKRDRNLARERDRALAQTPAGVDPEALANQVAILDDEREVQ